MLLKLIDQHGASIWPQYQAWWHGKSVAVVISRETFDRLSQTQDSLVDFMRRSPLYGADDLVFERDPSPIREIAF